MGEILRADGIRGSGWGLSANNAEGEIDRADSLLWPSAGLGQDVDIRFDAAWSGDVLTKPISSSDESEGLGVTRNDFVGWSNPRFGGGGGRGASNKCLAGMGKAAASLGEATLPA